MGKRKSLNLLFIVDFFLLHFSQCHCSFYNTETQQTETEKQNLLLIVNHAASTLLSDSRSKKGCHNYAHCAVTWVASAL